MMKIITLFFISIASLFASSSDIYSFKYEYHNPSLGPIDGSQKALVTIKNGSVASIVDLKSGRKYKDAKRFPIATMIVTILKDTNTKYKNYKVEFDKKGIPSKIESKDGGFFINVEDFKKVGSNAKSLDRKTFLSKRYEYNLKKWHKNKIKNYKYNYKFSSDKKHIDGIMVTVKNGKTVQAIDEFSRKNIKVNKSILDIDRIFKVVKYLIDKRELKEVTYDKLYGYPTYIKYNNKHNVQTSVVISQFIKLAK